jgi:ABC-type nickel/cobalt efflux system permease component RcnA
MLHAVVLRLSLALTVGFAVLVVVGTLLLAFGPALSMRGVLIHYQVLAGLSVGTLAAWEVYRRAGMRQHRTSAVEGR